MKLGSQEPPRLRAARRPVAVARKVLQGRPPGARRRVDHSLEQQADKVADQAVRHAPNVGRLITPAPPASYDAPASAGQPLAPAVREELEASFGADLRAVRIHDDAAAHAAARAEEAEAFTAGCRIFFAEGKHDPASMTGRHLLAHELAHVLQQTGRRTSSTMIEAREREGMGDVQAAPAAFAVAPLRRYGAELTELRRARPGGSDHTDDDEEDDEGARHG